MYVGNLPLDASLNLFVDASVFQSRICGMPALAIMGHRKVLSRYRTVPSDVFSSPNDRAASLPQNAVNRRCIPFAHSGLTTGPDLLLVQAN